MTDTPTAADLPDEPPNSTALYWPETRDDYATLLVRSDDATVMSVQEFGADHRWYMPNTASEVLTWDEAVERIHDVGLMLGNAIVLRPAGEVTP